MSDGGLPIVSNFLRRFKLKWTAVWAEVAGDKLSVVAFYWKV